MLAENPAGEAFGHAEPLHDTVDADTTARIMAPARLLLRRVRMAVFQSVFWLRL